MSSQKKRDVRKREAVGLAACGARSAASVARGGSRDLPRLCLRTRVEVYIPGLGDASRNERQARLSEGLAASRRTRRAAQPRTRNTTRRPRKRQCESYLQF